MKPLAIQVFESSPQRPSIALLKYLLCSTAASANVADVGRFGIKAVTEPVMDDFKIQTCARDPG